MTYGMVSELKSRQSRLGSETNTATSAVDETVILLHPPLPSVGVSIVMERERQQNDSLARSMATPPRRTGGRRRGIGWPGW